MRAFEYDVEQFALVEKWNPKKQKEKMAEMVADLNAKGAEGWELMGLHTFELVGGITGTAKGTTTLTLWKRELGIPTV
jgi:hypothetical protein